MTSDTAAATTAPAKTAPHDTADRDDSGAADTIVLSTMLIADPQRKKRARRMMIGIGTPSSHKRIPRPMSVSFG
jgi:hypothetical protein